MAVGKKFGILSQGWSLQPSFSTKYFLWTRGQSDYTQVTGRGRVEALGIRIESGRPKVLPVRCLVARDNMEAAMRTITVDIDKNLP